MKNFSGNYGDTLAKASAMMPRCYESHPALPIGNYFIYGGSCAYPAVKDADIYIGLDHNSRQTTGAYPWNNKRVEVHFPITDMSAPKDAEEFKKMVEWTALQLIAGKKVHAGCIGGHGRTGTFFAALVTHMTGEKDSITYVRKNYCDHAVESESQVKFLMKHYGITKVAGYKEGKVYTGETSVTAGPWKGKDAVPFKSEAGKWAGQANSKDIFPVASKKSLWLAVKK
jgi:hypothetical protein